MNAVELVFARIVPSKKHKNNTEIQQRCILFDTIRQERKKNVVKSKQGIVVCLERVL